MSERDDTRAIVRERVKANLAERTAAHRQRANAQRALPLGLPELPAEWPLLPPADRDGVVAAPERIRYIAALMRKGLWVRNRTAAQLAPHLGVSAATVVADSKHAKAWVVARLDELGLAEIRAEIVCDLRWARARAKSLAQRAPDKAARLVIDTARALAEITGASAPRASISRVEVHSGPAEIPPWLEVDAEETSDE